MEFASPQPPAPATAAPLSSAQQAALQNRGKYRCSRCGQPKRGHICPVTGEASNQSDAKALRAAGLTPLASVSQSHKATKAPSSSSADVGGARPKRMAALGAASNIRNAARYEMSRGKDPADTYVAPSSVPVPAPRAMVGPFAVSEGVNPEVDEAELQAMRALQWKQSQTLAPDQLASLLQQWDAADTTTARRGAEQTTQVQVVTSGANEPLQQQRTLSKPAVENMKKTLRELRLDPELDPQITAAALRFFQLQRAYLPRPPADATAASEAAPTTHAQLGSGAGRDRKPVAGAGAEAETDADAEVDVDMTSLDDAGSARAEKLVGDGHVSHKEDVVMDDTRDSEADHGRDHENMEEKRIQSSLAQKAEVEPPLSKWQTDEPLSADVGRLIGIGAVHAQVYSQRLHMAKDLTYENGRKLYVDPNTGTVQVLGAYRTNVYVDDDWLEMQQAKMDRIREEELQKFEEELRLDQFSDQDSVQLSQELAKIEKPKPPPTAYIIWSMEVGRKELRERHPEAFERSGERYQLGLQSKLLSEMWQELGKDRPDEKAAINKRAKQLRQQYTRDLEDYQQKIARAREAMLSQHMQAMQSIVSMVQDEEERAAQLEMQRREEERKQRQQQKALRDQERRAKQAAEQAKHTKCAACRKRAKRAQRLECEDCKQAFHFSCLGITRPRYEYVKETAHFKCPRCTKCVTCEKDPQVVASYIPSDYKNIMQCDECHRGFHCAHVEPPYTRPPLHRWICDDCVKCHSCGATETANKKWYKSFTQCGSCYKLISEGKFCPVCKAAYKQADTSPMVGCDVCDKWVHISCDGISEQMYATMAEQDVPYTCPVCRADGKKPGPRATVTHSDAAAAAEMMPAPAAAPEKRKRTETSPAVQVDNKRARTGSHKKKVAPAAAPPPPPAAPAVNHGRRKSTGTTATSSTPVGARVTLKSRGGTATPAKRSKRRR